MELMTGTTSYYIKSLNTVRMDRFMIIVNLKVNLEVVDYLQLKSSAVIYPIINNDNIVGAYIQKYSLIVGIQNNGWVGYYKYDNNAAPLVSKYNFDTSFKIYPTQPKMITTFVD